MSTVAVALRPRKSPVQARSTATIDALHIAAIQVLTREGLSRCTTTRVAARAGISVGSLYQYYPNRDALLAAVLERHLDGVAGAVDRACREHHGKPVSEMASGLIAAFLAVKLRNPKESKALYAVSGERGGAALAARIHARIDGMLAAGWQDEVLRLTAVDGPENSKPFDFLGYKELRAVQRHEMTLPEARAAIQQSTRRYAKRQLTWFRRENSAHWLAGFGDSPQTQSQAAEFLKL